MKDFSYMADGDKFLGPDFEANARAAYDAYGVEVGGTTWDGKPIPTWDKITARQRNGWRKACATSLTEYLKYETHSMYSLDCMLNEHPGYNAESAGKATSLPEPQSNVNFHNYENDVG